MKIYFAGAIRAGREDAEVYEAMIAGSPGIQMAEYSSMDEAKTIMKTFIANVIEHRQSITG